MRFNQQIQFGMWMIVLILLLLPGVLLAQENVTVQLEAVDGSGVSGTAVLSPVDGGTTVILDIEGLTPNVAAQSAMHAGTCDLPSASFSALPALTADAAGKATATGAILFRGAEDIPLDTMTDGEHVIIIRTEDVVACGVIPQLAPPPASLPESGRMTSMPVFTGMLGLLLLCSGMSVSYRVRLLRVKI